MRFDIRVTRKYGHTDLPRIGNTFVVAVVVVAVSLTGSPKTRKKNRQTNRIHQTKRHGVVSAVFDIKCDEIEGGGGGGGRGGGGRGDRESKPG